MKTLLKIVGAAIAVVVVLLVAAAVLLPLLFDPNEHKAELAALVKEHTGRDLKIEGDIGLTVFPWLGAELGVLELGNAPGFQAASFARTEKVVVRLKLLPLLSRRVEMDTVTVHGLVLNLERKRDGSTNFDDLAGTGAGDSATVGSQDEGGPGLAAFALGGLDVQGANLTWADALSGQRYAVSNLSASTGVVSLGEPVTLALAFDVAGGKPAISGRITLDGTLAANVSSKVHELSGLTLGVDLKGDRFPNGALIASLNASVTADLGNDRAHLREFKLTVGDLVLNGTVSVAGLTGAPTYEGKFELSQFDPKALLVSLGLPGIETADPQALRKAAGLFEVKGTTEKAAISSLKLALDQSALTGSLDIVSFAHSAVRFDLLLDRIDADRYLPPASAKEGVATPGAAASAGFEIPSETLRGFDVAGTARIGALKVSNLRAADVMATINAKDGLVRLKPLGAKLYDGVYAGDIALDARGAVPAVSISESLKDVQAGPLLNDLQGVDRLTGTAAVTVRLTARGRAVPEMKKTLNGRVRFDFTNGAVKGVNINQMIRDAKAKLTGGRPGSSGPDQTDFTSLGGTINVKNGLATNTDLAAKSPFLRLAGKGQAHIADESIDYRLVTSVVASSVGQGGNGLEDLAGIDIPIRVTGSFAEPSYGLDVEALAAAFAKSKAANLVAGQKKAITRKATRAVQGKLGGVIGGALGRAGGQSGGNTGNTGRQSGEEAGGAVKKLGGALKGLLGN